MHKFSFQALACIPLAANFLIRVNLISQGIKGSSRCEGGRKKHGVTMFSLSLDFSHLFTLPKQLLEKVSKGTFPFTSLNPHLAK